MAEGQHVASSMDNEEQKRAAQMIQRNYRGYRERRQLEGMGLDASARWAEVGRPQGIVPTMMSMVWLIMVTRRYATVSSGFATYLYCAKLNS